MRTTKKERKENARKFYQSFLNGADRAVVVIEKSSSATNPYCNRVRFKAVCSLFKDEPLVIAEDNYLGIEGCFYELLDNIKRVSVQCGYYENGFADFLKKEYGLSVTYNDGMAMIIGYNRK